MMMKKINLCSFFHDCKICENIYKNEIYIQVKISVENVGNFARFSRECLSLFLHLAKKKIIYACNLPTCRCCV